LDIWEDTDGTCSSFESLIHAFNGFVHFNPISLWQTKTNKPLGKMYFQPFREVGCARVIELCHTLQQREIRGFVRGTEEGSQVLKYKGTKSRFGNMIHRVLYEIKPAALVGDAAKMCYDGLAQRSVRTEDRAISALGDTDDNMHSRASETSVDTDFFEPGIADEVSINAQRSRTGRFPVRRGENSYITYCRFFVRHSLGVLYPVFFSEAPISRAALGWLSK
jgi:hypothetical protein